jgi:hypothetical protein
MMRKEFIAYFAGVNIDQFEAVNMLAAKRKMKQKYSKADKIVIVPVEGSTKDDFAAAKKKSLEM